MLDHGSWPALWAFHIHIHRVVAAAFPVVAMQIALAQCQWLGGKGSGVKWGRGLPVGCMLKDHVAKAEQSQH